MMFLNNNNNSNNNNNWSQFTLMYYIFRVVKIRFACFTYIYIYIFRLLIRRLVLMGYYLVKYPIG